MNINTILAGLYIINNLVPTLAKIVDHYQNIIEAGEIKPEDKEKAKKLLEGARWEEWK